MKLVKTVLISMGIMFALTSVFYAIYSFVEWISRVWGDTGVAVFGISIIMFMVFLAICSIVWEEME